MATVDAEEVRRVCSGALLALVNGRTEEAQVALSEFAQKCGGLVQQEKMQGEQSAAALGEGTLDLGELRDMVRGNLHNDQPERDVG